MAAHSRRAPGELEADVLAALWRANEPLTPGEVREHLGSTLAYTTVMTILTRLYEKGSVTRRRVGRAFVYTPAFAQAESPVEDIGLIPVDAAIQAIIGAFLGGGIAGRTPEESVRGVASKSLARLLVRRSWQRVLRKLRLAD